MPRKNVKSTPLAKVVSTVKDDENPIERAKRLVPKDCLNHIKLTETQKKCLEVLDNNDICFITGPAGTAKTFLGCYYIIKAFINNQYSQVLLTKPIFEAGEKLGSLPGDVNDKIEPYYESYIHNLNKIIGRANVEKLIEKKNIIIKPISYMRGATYDNMILFGDEFQNFDAKSIILWTTRLGQNSKMIICGDVQQSDIKQEHVALPWFADLIKDIPKVGFFKFTEDDVVRNSILIEITKRYQRAKENGEIPKNKYH